MREEENKKIFVARGDGIHLEIRSCNSFVSLSSLRKFSLVYFKSGCGTISATDSVCSMSKCGWYNCGAQVILCRLSTLLLIIFKNSNAVYCVSNIISTTVSYSINKLFQ
jgi:hypothetical protein